MYKIITYRSNILNILACGLVVAIAFYLRFYKLTDLFVFTTDEEYSVYLAQTIVKHFHIIWIGENAANTGFYMGPFWVYFTALWLFLARGGVWILAGVASLIGVSTCLCLFLMAKKLYGIKAALIAGLLYAALPFIVYFDRKYWLLSPAPLVSILLFFFLYQTQFKKIYWVLIGFLYGMVFHVHLSLVPFGLPIIYLLWQQKKSLWTSKRVTLTALAAFLLAVSPLIAFDYFHKGSNITTPLRIGKDIAGKSTSIEPFQHLKYLLRTYGRLWYLAPYRSNSDEVLHACNPTYTNKGRHIISKTTTTTLPSIVFTLLSVVILAVFLLNSELRNHRSHRLLAGCFLLLVTGFLLLPNVPLEYYLLSSIPLFLLIVGQSLANINIRVFKPGVYLLVFLLVISGTKTVLTADPKFGLAIKINLVQKISRFIGKDSFELQEIGLCHGNEGWRYLFKQYGSLPAKSSVDNSTGYLYPDELGNQPTKYLVIISEARIPEKELFSKQAVFEEGGFNGYIISNPNK